jgi:DNA-binding winged helix-turn-helix (wHTH) protein/Tol biopolymer transport system component
MGFETNTLYRFEGFELDPANRVFMLAGRPIAIPARAFDLLLYMARNTERLLTKEELMKAVWGDTIVEEGNLTQSVFLLRKALSAQPSTGNKLIVTVPGRGYRFAAEVEQIAIPPPVPGALEISANGAPPLPEAAPSQPQAAGKVRHPNRWRSRWFIMGAVVGAATISALIVFPGGAGRERNKPVPLPHRLTANAAENPLITFALSPDGRYLAYTDAQSITIQTLPSGEARSIPLGSGVAPDRVIWYPDATRLIVGETVKDSPSVFVLSILSGKLSLLRENAVNAAVSPDGTRIVYTAGNIRELWLMDGNGENPRRVLALTAPDKLYPVSWSPDGGRVWFVRVHWEKEQESVTLETCDLKGGSRTVVLSDASARAFRLLPQGLIYAAVEGPQNFTNLWELPVNPAAGTPSGPLRKLTNWANFIITGISATANGKQVALLNGTWQADVYVGDLRAGGTELANTRRLSLDESNDYPAFWTPDGQSVVFFSNRNGRDQVFRQRLDQRVPELLSTDSGDAEYPRFGGPWIYYRSVPPGGHLSWNQPLAVRRIPENGGASSDVIQDAGIDVGCASGRPEICVLARLKGKALTFYRFDHAKGLGGEIGHMEYDSRLSPSFGLSPDGSEIAALDPRGIGNRIRRIRLNGGDVSEVEVPGRKEMEVLFWASDGKGWFVSSVTPNNGEYLLHVNPRGESQVLFEQPQDGRTTWGMPSHDGKHLAFLRWTAATNVWMIDDF